MPRLFYEQLFECNLQSSSRKKIKDLDISSWNWKLFLEVFKTYSDISARKSFVVNHAQSWNGNLNSIVFCSVTARTGINALVVRSKKSQKERTQMCFECKCRINNILGKKQWLSLPYSQCSLVIAHRCAEYESLRFDCSLELRIFFSDLCPWHDAKTSLLMTISYSTLKFWSVLEIGWLSKQGHNTNISSVWVSIPPEKVTKQRGLPWRVTPL